MADSTLAEIQKKVRKLSRAPSIEQLSDDDLNQYINTFVLYDFPSQLRLFALKGQFTFYTSPNIDTYSTVTAPTTAPLYNFKNQYITVNPPIYIGGLRAQYTQSLSALYDTYSKIAFKQQIAIGDGTYSGPYTTPTINNLSNVPFLQNEVIVNSIDVNGNPITLIDYPQGPNVGWLGVPDITPTSSAIYGTIGYLDGSFNINLPGIPAAQQPIFIQTVPYSPALPVMICYYNDSFILRPVPDGVYSVDMEVYSRPTELLSTGQSPDLEQWWQFIAYGAAKKVCEDRLEMELVQMLMPEYENQKEQVLNTTVVQNSIKRVPTPFAEQVGSGNCGGPGTPSVFNN
jgi:hypothetical protein